MKNRNVPFFAKVVLGLSVEGPFDYIVPQGLAKKIRPGCRVRVSFGTRKLVGYVVGLSHKTSIKNLKSLSEVLDEAPILDKQMLSLTKELSRYYCCSWGEAIETAIPESLRKGSLLPRIDNPPAPEKEGNSEVILIHDQDGPRRWEHYITAIKETLAAKRSVIMLFPDIEAALAAKEIINSRLLCRPQVLYRKQAHELESWVNVKAGKVDIAIGTRSAIFAPFNNLGLVIIDAEEDFVYKQDQVPHYHARVAAFMRAKAEKAGLILTSSSPSLESFSLAREAKINYIFIPRKSPFPQIKIINLTPLERKNKTILSKYLQDSIFEVLNAKGKALLFLNRKGFATFANCNSCGSVLKCPRCNINLVYHFKENALGCHYCNFKMQPPKLCPACNLGYIKYSGTGTEKAESELSRIFPQARIEVLDNAKQVKPEDADIFIATESILGAQYKFDLVAALSIDNSLNRVDFRAAEKVFRLLCGLLALTDKRLVIQTGFFAHHAFAALTEKDVNRFYDEELKQRKHLRFPPYSHLGRVLIRGEKESRVKDTSSALFKGLNERNKGKGLKIISLNAAQPAQLRGNFYWQILLRAQSANKLSKFLKINLKDFRHSGIIVTVDIDPL